MEFKDRLKFARKKVGFSQQKLADMIGIHVTNVSRYERGENKPTFEVLTKIGDALGVSTDYLMHGDLEDNANNEISDKELLLHFKRATKLPKDQQQLIKEFLDAFLMKAELKQKLA